MNYLCIGKFLKPFGLKGLIKTIFYIDDPEDLGCFSSFYIKDPRSFSGYKKIEINFVSSNDNFFIISVDGVVDRTVAESFRNLEIYVDESELPELSGSVYYIKDLVGLDVFYRGELFGSVINFIEVAGQSIMIIKILSGKEIAIPFKDRYFPEVLLKERRILADNIEDFL